MFKNISMSISHKNISMGGEINENVLYVTCVYVFFFQVRMSKIMTYLLSSLGVCLSFYHHSPTKKAEISLMPKS